MTGPTRAVRFIPLGGLGEVGMNCMAIEQDGKLVILDCGVTFPHEELGTELIHPRFDYLVERRADILGIIITHGHEDHIGALPYLLDLIGRGLPVYAPAHAAALIELRSKETGIRANLTRVATGVRTTLGSLEFEFVRVTHSITEACGLALWTRAGLVVHSGDFKLDDRPVDGERTDLARFGELADEGVVLMLSDSTNIESPGRSRSESEVVESLLGLVKQASGRVVIGMFASNIQRLSALGRVASSTGRKLCLLGRSVQNHVDVARQVGRLDWRSDVVVSPEMAARLPPSQLLIVASGTQGEPRAALYRLAMGEHPKISLEAGDTVMFSSRIIPGNDRGVFALYDALLARGLSVITRGKEPGIHASGHAHREEQRELIERLCPQSFLPVHGTRYQLTRHAELATEIGVQQSLVAQNGDVVELEPDGRLSVVAQVPKGRVHIQAGGAVADEVLAERRKLARGGVVAITVGGSQELQLVFRGVADADDPAFVNKVTGAARDALARARERQLDELAECERVVRRQVELLTGNRPMVIITSAARAPI